MSVIAEFSRTYIATLAELVSACSAKLRSRALNVVTDPGFAVAYSDRTGRQMLWLMSRDQTLGSLVIGDREIRHDGGNRMAFVEFDGPDLLERLLFPNITSDDFESSIRVSTPVPMTLDGLAFASREFNEKYWSDRHFVKFTASDVPFRVDNESTLLALDLLHGHEIDGDPHERLIEWVVIFGREELVPLEDHAIRDMAFRHFSSAVRAIEKPQSRFTEFLNHVSGSVESNVLLLGSYRSEMDAEDFERLKSVLRKFGYQGFMLKDAPDVARQSNREKLFCGIIASSFVVVLDSEPSGHIAEIAEMLSHPFRPAIIVRHSEKPATAFTEDSIQTAAHLRVAVLDDITEQSLLPHIQWAKAHVREQEAHYNTINSWRNV